MKDRIFKLNDDFSLKIDFDEYKQIWTETLVVKDFGEITDEIEEGFEKYTCMSRYCLLTLLRDEFDEECFFADRYFNISVDSEEDKPLITIQTDKFNEKDGTYPIDVEYLSKERMMELSDFFYYSATRDIEKILHKRFKK